jgi:hypothetical protein
LEAEGFPTTHTKTFTLTDSDIEEVTFQVPNLNLYDLLALNLGVTLSSEKCQLVSTVTILGGSLYLPNAHGEAGATVAIDPIDASADGPIYFNESVIPDRSWTETSSDGGIVFINTEPGDYILTATKEGVVFDSVKLKCRPGSSRTRRRPMLCRSPSTFSSEGLALPKSGEKPYTHRTSVGGRDASASLRPRRCALSG